MIRTATTADAEAICKIYNHFIEHTIVTFDEEPVAPEDMALKIGSILERFPWLVYEHEGRVLGYAYAGEWKSRCSYKYTVESTVYVQPGEEGKGIGSQLYGALLEQLNTANVHSVIGGISLPNSTSIALHEKFGFEQVARFREVGHKFGQWIDVGYWELLMK